MQIDNFTIISKDTLQLKGKSYFPPEEPVGVVCIIHGLGEHMGRYRHVAEFLTRKQFAVYTFDLRGHGTSGGERGHISSYELLLDDVDQVIGQIRMSYIDLPFFYMATVWVEI